MMCWLDLAIAVIFAGYCGYMRHVDKSEIGYLERVNVRLTEHIKQLKDEQVLDGIQRKSDGAKVKPAYGEDVKYD
jgi:cell division protein FtsB